MRTIRVAAALLAATAVVGPSSTAFAAPTPDPGLAQKVDANEKTATQKVEVGKGHVDLGPRATANGWELMARDDTVTPPVWRHLDDVLLRVHDTARMERPSDKSFDFLASPAGAQVHVIPQTELRDVVWLGWNTQHPSIANRIGRGATLKLDGVEGPGQLDVFLANGFDAPQPLWRHDGPAGQSLWMDANTHVHANWVFSKPGTYLVHLRVEAKDPTGPQLVDRKVVRIAVGDQVSRDEAFAAVPKAIDVTDQAPASPASAGTRNWIATLVPAVLGLGGLAALVTGLTMRNRRVKKAALADDAKTEGTDE